MSQELLRQNETFIFEARNPRPMFRRLKSGNFYGVNLEIDEETWNRIKTLPDNALLAMVLYWHDGDEAPDVQISEKAEKGPHGRFWQTMFKRGFWANLDLQQILRENTADGIRVALHKALQVGSLTQASPEQFKEWLKKHRLESLIVLTEQAAMADELKLAG